MECPSGFIVFVIIFIVIAVIRAIANWSGEQGYHSNIQSAVDRGLSVRCKNDTVHTDDGQNLPVIEVSISGVIAVPRHNYPVAIRVWMTDITENESDPYAVFCTISDLTDEKGFYYFLEKTHVPYQLTEVDGMPVTGIPAFALVLPKKGQRKLRVVVVVTSQFNEDEAYAVGMTTIWHTQQTAGYLEFEQQTREQERQIALLALAVAAADGTVDKREVGVIRRFFTERLEGREDAEERRARITETLQDAMGGIKSGRRESSQMLVDLCQEITQHNDSAFSQSCYELCVEVAVADEVLHDDEQSALRFIASNLQLPSEFVREVHDRNVRLSHFHEGEDEKLIGMPSGLSREEKIAFLNEEYNKWRRRATHKDPKIAAEASLRLERITKLRRALTDE